jgi:hypothetical protein
MLSGRLTTLIPVVAAFYFSGFNAEKGSGDNQTADKYKPGR